MLRCLKNVREDGEAKNRPVGLFFHAGKVRSLRDVTSRIRLDHHATADPLADGLGLNVRVLRERHMDDAPLKG